MNGLKKAALFLSNLGYAEADQLLSRLDGESARMIRREIMALRHGNVSVDESHRLDEEFLHTAGWKPTGPYREYQFAAPAPPPQATYTMPKRPAVQNAPAKYTAESMIPPVRSFDFMRNWSAHDIAHAIIDEHPQAIAVVLAHLPQSKMQLVLSVFPVELQREIGNRLEHYEMPDAQVVQEIESALKVRYRHQYRPARQSATLESFDDVEMLSDADLGTLFRSIDLTKAMLALIGAEPTLIARVTRHFSPTEEHEMRRRLKQLGHIDDEQIEQARRDILQQYNATV